MHRSPHLALVRERLAEVPAPRALRPPVRTTHTAEPAATAVARVRWTRGQVTGLAPMHCTQCFGLGLEGGNHRSTQPCGCVLRKIFTLCHSRYQELGFEIAGQGVGSTLVRIGGGDGAKHHFCYSRREEEFRSDFETVARRALETDQQRTIFRRYFCEDEPAARAGRGLGLTMGEFYHEVYRIQQRVGRAFAEVRPYPLYPIDAYFGQPVSTEVLNGALAELRRGHIARAFGAKPRGMGLRLERARDREIGKAA